MEVNNRKLTPTPPGLLRPKTMHTRVHLLLPPALRKTTRSYTQNATHTTQGSAPSPLPPLRRRWAL